MRDIELLRLLFQAHQDDNDDLFNQTAQSIVNKQLAANHHAEATELLRALKPNKRTVLPKLNTVPARESISDLITFPVLKQNHVIPLLSEEVEAALEQFKQERREAERLSAYGLTPKSKLIFWGPPGCGKTVTAEYLSVELNLEFAVMDLGRIISSMLGGTAAQLRKVFDYAASRSILLLLDEFDTIGKERDDSHDVGESRRIVNSVLQLLERFSSPTSVVIAATNHETLLDSALWRRFDDVVEFRLPNESERSKLLRNLLSGIAYSGSLQEFARAASGLSHADISSIVTNATKLMILSRRKSISSSDLIDQILKRKRMLTRTRSRAAAKNC